MLVGRIIETEAAFLDSAGNDRGSSHPFDMTLSGPMPELAGFDAGSFWEDPWGAVTDVATSAVDAVVDVSTSVADRATDAANAITSTLQQIAGPILDTAQTWFDTVASWGGNATEWVGNLAKKVAEGVAAYGGNLDEWLHALPVVAQIYDGIRATVKLGTQVLSIVPRLGIAITSGKNLGEFLANEIRDFGRNAGVAAEFAAALASFIPGLGQVVGPALALAGKLLQGENVSDAIIAACCTALPGGALVQSGAQLGARVGYALASGERIDRAALKALKDALPEDARAAFVATVELAQGETLATAIKKAAAEGINTSALLKSAGVDTSFVADFADVVKYNNFPKPILDGIGSLRGLGGSVAASIDITVPRFPSVDEARALAAKAGISEVEAHVAIAAFGGAEVRVFNVSVCPLVLKAKLELLRAQAKNPMGLPRIIAILQQTALGTKNPETIGQTASAIWSAGRGKAEDFELAVAKAWNLAAANEAVRTMKGGAHRMEVGQTIIVHGKTKGAPKVYNKIRAQRLVPAATGNLARRIALGEIKLPTSPLETVAPRYRPFFRALSAPTPIVEVKSPLAVARSSTIIVRPRILTLPQAKGSTK